MKLGIETNEFNSERFNELSEKDNVYRIEEYKLVIVNQVLLETLGQYVGIREFTNSDMQNLLVVDEDIEKIIPERHNMPARAAFSFHINNFIISVVQGHLLYTDSVKNYEIALINKIGGWVDSKTFKKLNIPKETPIGDYAYVMDGDKGCGIIGYLPFKHLCTYIIHCRLCNIDITNTELKF